MTTVPGDPPPPRTVTFRRSVLRWSLVLLACVAPGIIFVSGATVPSTHGWEKIACWTVVLALAIVGIRIVRMGIFAGPGELVVRNFFRSYKIDWRDISGFEIAPSGIWMIFGVKIRLLDGQVVSDTLYGGRILSGFPARKVIGELEQLRRQRARDAGTARQPP